MTTLSLLDFDAGTEGSAVTVSAPWSKTGSSAVAYRAAAAVHGAFGARFSNTGTSGRYQYDYGSAQTGVLVLSMYVTPRTHASAVQYLALATTLTSGGTNRGDVRINNTTRTVTLRNVTTAVATSTTALAVGTTYRLEWRLDHAADTQTLRIYLGDATTPTETLTGAYSAADTRVLAFGPYTAATGGATDYDSVQVANDWTGPYVPPAPFPDPDPTKIGHIGDSLTAQSPGPGTADMDARYLAAGYADADVDGISGRFVYNAGDTSGGTPAVIDAWVAADFNPYDIVIALGTNDTLNALSTNWLTGLNNLRAKIAADLPGAHRIWWVNVVAAPDNPGGMDGGIGTKSNTVADYNAFLVANLNGTTERILDWNAYAQANLTDLANWNTSDGIHVHMTSTGYTARNAWIAELFGAATGSASGARTRSGTAAGARAAAGAATGARTRSGAAAGARAAAGIAAGALVWAGAAVGAAAYQGSAAGERTRTGTAAGAALHEGAATGSRTRSGAAEGVAPGIGAATGSAAGGRSWSGAATGTTVYQGTATGARTRSGAAVGAAGHAGAAAGARERTGSAAGAASRVGTAAGSRSRDGSALGFSPTVGGAQGSAAGSRTRSGVAVGAAQPLGAASGSRTRAGTATGRTAPAGTATGARSRSGVAAGVTRPLGTAAGGRTRAGTAMGAATALGSAAGARTRSGAAVGTSQTARDVVVLRFDERGRAVLFDDAPRQVTFSPAQRRVSYTYTEEMPMQLNPWARELYNPGPVTAPPVSGWEASFDEGATWHPSTVVDDRETWLVAGPSAEPGAAVAVITGHTQPLLRVAANPEVIVRRAPEITLYD